MYSKRPTFFVDDNFEDYIFGIQNIYIRTSAMAKTCNVIPATVHFKRNNNPYLIMSIDVGDVLCLRKQHRNNDDNKVCALISSVTYSKSGRKAIIDLEIL
jgi:hypothetical protein